VDIDQQQRLIIKGILISLDTKNDTQRHNVLNEVAKLISLEDTIGDKGFSFRIAASIPAACILVENQGVFVNMCDRNTLMRTIQLLRTRFYIIGVRSQITKH
jgi:hypothetical protein